MAVFQTYQNYANHGRTFNTYFLTFLSVLTSIMTGMFLYNVKILNSNNAGWILTILIAVPILIFIANWNNYSLRIAFYKTWKDILQGRVDRKKLLKEFARTYHVRTWRKKVEHIEVDGRWNFKANTPYIRGLTEERDSWISLLYQECIDKVADIDKQIITARNHNDNNNRELNLATQTANEAEDMLSNAKSAAETYYQRQKVAIKRTVKKDFEQNVLNSEHSIRALQIERKNIIDDFCQSATRIIDSYNGRYEKYAESAVKILNKINNLHYVILPIPESSLTQFRKDLINGNF